MSSRYQTVILGAGLCGLSAAWHLEQKGDADYILLERGPVAGGLACTGTIDGFSFDHAIHILYSGNPYIEDLICNRLLKDNIRRQVRKSFCYTEGVFTEYPYQTNNFGLPPAVILENLMGLIQAKIAAKNDLAPRHFEEWIYRNFGRGIADHFMVPYNRRLWAWDLKNMTADWIAGRVPVPEMSDVLRGALKPPEKKFGPNQEFWYPVNGGIEALPKAFLRDIPPDRIRLNTMVAAVDGAGHELVLEDGRHIWYDRLISTIPLPHLVSLLGTGVPPTIRTSAGELHSNSVHTVNIGFDGEEMGPLESMHWVYFPEDRTVFHRASMPGAFASSMVPDGCSSIQLEVSESIHRPCNRSTLAERCLADLIRAGILRDRDRMRVQVSRVVTLDPAYIIYDAQRMDHVRTITRYLGRCGIRSYGRFGEWEYLNMDQAILSGKRAAEEVEWRLPSCG